MLDITVEVSSIIRKHLIPSATENSKSFFYSEKENYYRKSVEIPIANNLREQSKLHNWRRKNFIKCKAAIM